MVKRWMRRISLSVILVCLVGFPLNSKTQAGPQAFQRNDNSTLSSLGDHQNLLPAGFQIVTSTRSSLVLEIHVPHYDLETHISEGKSCELLNIDGYFQSGEPGQPGLLSAGVLLGIPFNSSPSYKIHVIDAIDIPGQIHLCPVATPVIQSDPRGLIYEQGSELQENSLTYSQDTYIPSQPIDLSISGMIRSQRVARLVFTPFLYNPARDELKSIRYLKIEVKLTDDDGKSPSSSFVNEGPFEFTLQKILINYNQARQWRLMPQPDSSIHSIDNYLLMSDQSKYKIQVDRDGLYQVTYEALQIAGLPVDSTDPHTFKLHNRGVEIPVLFIGEEDGVFNPEDYLLFYGQKNSSKFTNVNIYWLSWGVGNGLRMSTSDGTVHDAVIPQSFRKTVHLEEDHRYVNTSPSGPQLDHWYWVFMNANGNPVSYDFTFSLQNIDANSPSVKIRGLLKGYYANPQHHTLLYLNGNPIDDHTWPSGEEYSFSIDIPISYLYELTNTLKIECPLDGGITIDQELVNWFEIDYNHTFTSENNLLDFNEDELGSWQFQIEGFNSDEIDVFDITYPSSPIWIIGGTILEVGHQYTLNFEQEANGETRYIALTPSRWLTPISIMLDNPSSLKKTANRADYIIISPADFLHAIQPLANYWEFRGLRVKVVDIQDIYDEFASGVFDPQAIHDFLAYANSNWITPGPSFVLLVGDGHYDFINNYGDSGMNYIPPYLGEFDPWIGETASDNRYVTISGDDILPDMYIGRLPINSVDETNDMVEKILDYEQNPIQDDWNTNLTFIADDADEGGNFPGLSDNIIANYLPEAYIAERIYFGIDPYSSADETRAAIVNAVNQGRLLVSYVGHGSIQFWAAENLLSVNSIDSLTNFDIYPFFAPMTCAEGYFIFPQAQGYNYPSLAESLVRSINKGAIADFSPAGFGLAGGHDLLAQGLFQAFFSDGLIRFGQATIYAKYYLYANGPDYRDLIDTYNLFGDPAARLKIESTWLYITNLPVMMKK